MSQGKGDSDGQWHQSQVDRRNIAHVLLWRMVCLGLCYLSCDSLNLQVEPWALCSYCHQRMMDLDLLSMPSQTLWVLSSLQTPLIEKDQGVAHAVPAGSLGPEARAQQKWRCVRPGKTNLSCGSYPAWSHSLVEVSARLHHLQKPPFLRQQRPP